jgi:hypothetical protein
MGGGIGDQKAADQRVAAIGADVVLVAEGRDGEVDLRLAVLGLRLRGLDRPARITVLLSKLRRLRPPVLRDAAVP